MTLQGSGATYIPPHGYEFLGKQIERNKRERKF